MAGVITQVNGIEDVETVYLIQAIVLFYGNCRWCFYRKYRSKSKTSSKYPYDKVLYFIPIILMELIVLIPGILTKDFTFITT